MTALEEAIHNVAKLQRRGMADGGKTRGINSTNMNIMSSQTTQSDAYLSAVSVPPTTSDGTSSNPSFQACLPSAWSLA